MSKTFLVTGASSGIGAATVTQLLARGHSVYAAARRLGHMSHLEALGARLLALDLEDDASIVAAVDTLMSEVGRIDGLVNNAGYGSYGAVEDVSLDEARRQFEVNLFGLARLTQLCLPAMRTQKAGRIVNVSSIGGCIHEPMGAWYHATKFALEGFSNCLRMELTPHGIDVIVVQPGAIATEWSGVAQQSLRAVSGNGAYAAQAEAIGRLLNSADGKGASPPEIVARAIVKAIEVRHPRTRYAAGRGASILLTLRWLLTDKAFDKAMNMVMRNASNQKMSDLDRQNNMLECPK
jgi:short-subunit dehydrogenase